MEFHERLREARLRAGLTQKEVADRKQMPGIDSTNLVKVYPALHSPPAWPTRSVCHSTGWPDAPTKWNKLIRDPFYLPDCVHK